MIYLVRIHFTLLVAQVETLPLMSAVNLSLTNNPAIEITNIMTHHPAIVMITIRVIIMEEEIIEIIMMTTMINVMLIVKTIIVTIIETIIEIIEIGITKTANMMILGEPVAESIIGTPETDNGIKTSPIKMDLMLLSRISLKLKFSNNSKRLRLRMPNTSLIKKH